MSSLKIKRQYISEKILKARQDVCKHITEEMTIKQAYIKLGNTDVGYNSFYNQCKALILMGYLKECGYHIEGRTHSLKIVSIQPVYVYEFHNRFSVQPDAPITSSEPRLIKLTNTEHWYSEKKKSGKVHASGSTLNMVMATANY
jgi:hypothetical protein